MLDTDGNISKEFQTIDIDTLSIFWWLIATW